MSWIVRLVETGPAARRRSVNVMEIDRSGDRGGNQQSRSEPGRRKAAVARSTGGCRGAGPRACRPSPELRGLRGTVPGEGLSYASGRYRFWPRGHVPSPLSLRRVWENHSRCELAIALSLNARAGSAKGLFVRADELSFGRCGAERTSPGPCRRSSRDPTKPHLENRREPARTCGIRLSQCRRRHSPSSRSRWLRPISGAASQESGTLKCGWGTSKPGPAHGTCSRP
jgi:hypothetical protein